MGRITQVVSGCHLPYHLCSEVVNSNSGKVRNYYDLLRSASILVTTPNSVPINLVFTKLSRTG